jgi:hypothetical protein
MDDEEPTEQNISSQQPSKKSTLTLQQAVDYGEYNSHYLANFPEWHGLSSHIQWQLIRKALDIRHRQLMTHYAKLSNTLDLSKKPVVQNAMKNLEKQPDTLSRDKERLYVEYSTKI